MPRRSNDSEAPAEQLDRLAQEALALSKKARRHRKNLSGDNFYGNKLANLRADATSAFRQLSVRSVGDSSALAELVETAFSATAEREKRLSATRELTLALRTAWQPQADVSKPSADGDLFPPTILVEAKRGYLVTVGRQMNGCFRAGWFDSCAVMMRRLVEIAIIEAFEANGIANKITDANGNYFQLSDLVDAALNESKWTLSRNAKKYLPKLRDIGHQSAHGRYYSARRDDILAVQPGCRVVIEEFLHLAKLL